MTYLRSDVRIFFWLPKTAGGTLAAGIRNNGGVRWLYWIEPDQIPAPSTDQIWFGGHLHFGHHLLYGAEPSYITILRDPIKRLIAEFFYHHQHPMPGIFIPDDEIVPAFVRLVEATPHLNYYCYMFSAYCAQKEAAHLGLSAWAGDPTKGYELIKGRDKRFGFLVENVAFEKIGIDGALRRASNNLDSMRFIGFFDHLENATAKTQARIRTECRAQH